MKPESRLVIKIQERLHRTPQCWHMKVHGSMFQAAGIPDIIGCYQGRFFGLEAKVGANEPTVLQTKCMDKLKAAGAIVAVVRSLEDVIAALDLPPPIEKKKSAS
jgi:hypothetical protein